ncbi:transcription factor SPT20 homolog [Oncorhynchus clarkii lewisi]|uniref:transcription factor SPT20 homolog n=1 Tax=Oncorhynchus clarkii lewisi TaxID=490388 RepID=UPI0039B8FD4D
MLQTELVQMPILQKQPTAIPQQAWYPAQNPQQQKQLATMLQKPTAPMPQPQKQQATMPLQVWHPAQMPQQQKQPATEPKQQIEQTAMPQPLAELWHPDQFLQKQKQPVPMHLPQNELTAIPRQLWQTAQMPQQHKQPAAMLQQVWHLAQKQPVPMPQQPHNVWYPAKMVQKQQHYKSTEDGASSSTQASIVEQSGAIPIYSYSSKSHYENGRTVFSQTRYTPREAMPVDSGNAPKDSYVGIAAPSVNPSLVKDSAR